MRSEVLAKGSIEKANVLTQCILSCEEFKKTDKTHIFDYCIYFLYKMVQALLKNEKCVLNRPSNGYLKIYYEICESLFKIDTNAKRDEKDKPAENEEKEEEGPKESVFGTDKKLESYKDFSDYHLAWVKEVLQGHQAVSYHFRSASGEDIKAEMVKKAEEYIQDKKNKDL